MPGCPGCLGDGFLDLRDLDASLAEHFPVSVIGPPVGIIECEECEGTGVVSEDRARDLHAVAVAAVDQALAKFYDQHPEERTTR